MEVLKYRKDANSPWQSIVALKGEPGKDGAQGPQGIQGEPGKDGAKGADGYTPVKGVDYFDGAPGKDGEKGEQGIQGPQGEPGKDGENYILTEEDKQEIVNLVIAAMPEQPSYPSSEEVAY